MNSQVIAQDQDTVIGDAMVEASIIVYDAAKHIARNIAENAQYAIDLEELRKAELALAYMQGVDFGLAMDVKRMQTYLAYMEKTMASINKSRQSGFQLQIDVPPEPSNFLGFDDEHAMAVGQIFLHALFTNPPSEKRIKELEDEMYKDEGKDPSKLVTDPNDPSGKTLVMASKVIEDVPEAADPDDDSSIREEYAEDAAPKKPPKSVHKDVAKEGEKMKKDGADFKAKVAGVLKKIEKDDASLKTNKLIITTTDKGVVLTFHPEGSTEGERKKSGLRIKEELIKNGIEVKKCYFLLGGFNTQIITIEKPRTEALDGISELRTLKNLYRTNRIDKSALKGGLATLLATGIITKAEFYGVLHDSQYS